MHLSSLDNLTTCVRRHVLADPVLGSRRPLRVLEVGAAEFTTGNYRDAFDAIEREYIGVDIAAGQGVDIVLEDPYVLPFDDQSFDVVLCGQTLEHNPQFWRSVAEMARVLRPDGVLVIIVPSAGPVHRYPVDCYRFLPDAMQGLDGIGGLRLVDDWISEYGPWHDHVGVFRPEGFDPSLADLRIDVTTFPSAAPQNEHLPDLPPEVERGSGEQDKYEFMSALHETLEPRFYFEIGVEYGNSIRLASCPALGVDPAPQLTAPLAEHHRVSRHTSDDFFRHTDEPAAMPTVDMAYLDGMHLAEFLLKDFMHIERHCDRFSVVVIDDVFPVHPIQAERTRRSRFWTGDVWKLIPLLRGARPDLILLPVDTYPTGTLLVLNPDPTALPLWESFDVFVDWIHNFMTEIHPEILEREGALHPHDPLIERVMGLLRAGRAADHAEPGAGDAYLDRIRHLLAGAFPRKLAR